MPLSACSRGGDAIAAPPRGGAQCQLWPQRNSTVAIKTRAPPPGPAAFCGHNSTQQWPHNPTPRAAACALASAACQYWPLLPLQWPTMAWDTEPVMATICAYGAHHHTPRVRARAAVRRDPACTYNQLQHVSHATTAWWTSACPNAARSIRWPAPQVVIRAHAAREPSPAQHGQQVPMLPMPIRSCVCATASL